MTVEIAPLTRIHMTPDLRQEIFDSLCAVNCILEAAKSKKTIVSVTKTMKVFDQVQRINQDLLKRMRE